MAKGDRPSISGKTVHTGRERVAYHVRPKGSERHPDAAYTIPSKRDKRMVIDVILLVSSIAAAVIAALLNII